MAFPPFFKGTLIALLVSPLVSSSFARAAHRRRRVQPTTIGVEFGGTENKYAQSWQGSDFYNRPELVKSLKCTSMTSCQECESEDSCWHGTNPDGDKWGYLDIHVPADSSFTIFKADVWAHCDSAKEGEAEWSISDYTSNNIDGNGKISLYRDGERIISQVRSDIHQDVPMTANAQRFSVVFSRVDPTRESRGRVWFDADKLSPSVSDCMDVKDCLTDFGDGSASSFKLRNVNEMQRKCLHQQTEGMTAEELTKCGQWRNCLSKSGKKDVLLSLLDAATVGAATVGATTEASCMCDAAFPYCWEYDAYCYKSATSWDRSQTTCPGTCTSHNLEADESDLLQNARASSAECTDPSVADPETWDCDCAEEMEHRCGESDYEGVSLSCCFQDLMCKSQKICSTWKETHCTCPNGPTNTCEMKSTCQATLLQSDSNNSMSSMTKLEMQYAEVQDTGIEAKHQMTRKFIANRAKSLKADRGAAEGESQKERLARKNIASRAISIKADGRFVRDEAKNQKTSAGGTRAARTLDSSAADKCS